MQITIEAFEDTGPPVQLTFCSTADNIIITIPGHDDVGIVVHRSFYVDTLEWARLLEAGRAFLVEKVYGNT